MYFSHVHITSIFLCTAMRCDRFKVCDISYDISQKLCDIHNILYHISHISLIFDLYFMILCDSLDYIHLVASVLARGWDLCRTGKALARYLTICARYVQNMHE